MEVDRTAYIPGSGNPVLFGSSLKGAIRTALLNDRNKRAPLDHGERRPFDNYRGAYQQGNRDEMRSAEKKQMPRSAPHLQQRLFKFSQGEFEHDPLRLVGLSDAIWQGETDLPSAQVSLAVNRKRAPVVDAQGILRKSKAHDLYQILECVPGFRYRAFAGQLTVQSPAGLDARHRDKLPATDLRFDMGHIARACNDFYRPILDEEIRQMHKRGYLDAVWEKTLREVLQANTERFRRGELFLLRVGRHSGAESVTLNGVRNIKITKAQGQPAEYLDTPKTWWLAAEDKDQMRNLLPFGWLLIEVHSMQAALPDWPELQTACAPHLAVAHEMADRLQAKAKEIEQARSQAEAKRLAEEEKRRRQAEAETQRQRDETDRLARLANLTPNLQSVDTFITNAKQRHEQLGGGRDKPNMGIHTQASQLVNKAQEDGDWTPEEKRALAEAIETWLPRIVERFDRKDDWKNARKRLNLAALKGEG
jgi:CRISPR-associated protein Csm5